MGSIGTGTTATITSGTGITGTAEVRAARGAAASEDC
jgi:hypothetical protein